MHPAYKNQARAAIEAATAATCPQRKLDTITRRTGGARKGDRVSPRALALRACGFVPHGDAYRLATGGAASHAYQWVAEYLHRPTGRIVRCAA